MQFTDKELEYYKSIDWYSSSALGSSARSNLNKILLTERFVEICKFSNGEILYQLDKLDISFSEGEFKVVYKESDSVFLATLDQLPAQCGGLTIQVKYIIGSVSFIRFCLFLVRELGYRTGFAGQFLFSSQPVEWDKVLENQDKWVIIEELTAGQTITLFSHTLDNYYYNSKVKGYV